MKKTWGLRIRLMVLMLILTLIPLLMFAVISEITLYSAMKYSLDGRIQAELDKSNRSLTLALEKYQTLLYDFATDDTVVEMMVSYNQGVVSLETVQNELGRRLKHICNRNENVAGMAVYAVDGTCIYYDWLSSTATESVWIDSELNIPMKGAESYQPSRYIMDVAGEKQYVFSIHRKFVDYKDIHRPVGSAVICVDERVLQEAMEGSGEEVFFLENDDVIISAPMSDAIGTRLDEQEREPQGLLSKFTTASEINETTGWNIVEYYPLIQFNQTLETQIVQVAAIVVGVILIFVAGIYSVTHPVIISVENILHAMKQAGKGDYSARIQQDKGIPSEMWEISHGFNAMAEQTEELIAQIRRANREQRNAEISALEAQIDPHFLYNVLDTINWKAIAREEYEISEMVGDLGDILRYAIKNAGGITTLGQEIAWLKKYVRLQQEKIGREIQIFCEVSPEAAGAGMHKLLLQPFVENSIKHGLAAASREPLLIISGEIRDGELIVTVEDNGKGLDEETVATLNREDYHKQDHFGIENVRKRLLLYYGKEAGCSFEGEAGRFTRVTLHLPVLGECEQ